MKNLRFIQVQDGFIICLSRLLTADLHFGTWKVWLQDWDW